MIEGFLIKSNYVYCFLSDIWQYDILGFAGKMKEIYKITFRRIALISKLNHLDILEAESIYIMREVASECERPVMLYSIGKDSSVMLHLALKAFYPEKPPFPFLHVNTTWKFKEMIEFREMNL